MRILVLDAVQVGNRQELARLVVALLPRHAAQLQAKRDEDDRYFAAQFEPRETRMGPPKRYPLYYVAGTVAWSICPVLFITSMFVGDQGEHRPGTKPGHGLVVSARGDAVSIETGRMMQRA